MCSFLLGFIIIYHLKAVVADFSKLEETVDLTWSFDNNTFYWKDRLPFVLTKTLTDVHVDSIWYAEFCGGEQRGTHFDAPHHYYKSGWTVDQIPLARLVAAGILIDLSYVSRTVDENFLLLPEHLKEWERNNGPIPDNCVILINFGWLRYYNRIRYVGAEKRSELNYPGVSTAAAEWIIETHKVVGVGVDSPSVDPGSCVNFATHRLLSRHQIYMLENVKIPAWFPAKGYVLYVMPMKIANGAGAPLRLIAVPVDTGVVPKYLAYLKTPWYGHVVIAVSSITLFFIYAANWSD